MRPCPAIAPLPRHRAPAPSLRPRLVIAPPPRHCEERSNPLRPWRGHVDCHGAARLAMTRGVVIAPLPRHCAPASSLRGTKQSIAALAQARGLPRRCAPRNDGVCVSLRPWPVMRPRPVIARNEAIHCGLGAGTWIATSRHVASSSRLKAAPRNDGIRAERLAMTGPRAPRTDRAPRPPTCGFFLMEAAGFLYTVLSTVSTTTKSTQSVRFWDAGRPGWGAMAQRVKSQESAYLRAQQRHQQELKIPSCLGPPRRVGIFIADPILPRLNF